MRRIVLHNLDPQLEKSLREIAQQSGKSLNRVIRDILHKHFESHKKPPGRSLRKFAGGWTEDEAREFFASIIDCERIDS